MITVLHPLAYKFIQCAVCNKHVDKLEVKREELLTLRITVYCHGESETMSLSGTFAIDQEGFRGLAFAEKAVPLLE